MGCVAVYYRPQIQSRGIWLSRARANQKYIRARVHNHGMCCNFSIHYSDVTMTNMASQISCTRLLVQPFVSANIKNQRLCCWPFVRGTTGGFPSQRTNNAENVSMTSSCRRTGGCWIDIVKEASVFSQTYETNIQHTCSEWQSIINSNKLCHACANKIPSWNMYSLAQNIIHFEINMCGRTRFRLKSWIRYISPNNMFFVKLPQAHCH